PPHHHHTIKFSRTIRNKMNFGPGFDVAAHDYDGLLKGSDSTESISNGPSAMEGAPSPAAQQQQQQQQQPRTPSPSTDSAPYQQQQQHSQQQQQQQQQQPLNEPDIPAATSLPTMAPIPTRGPTFMGPSGVSEVKLKRFLEHNQRLREHLEMHRIPVSEASNR
ncbi:hypothetical protein BGW39_008307, partial [Mortierella sp. 14UC]